MYPNAADIRKLLMWLIDNMPTKGSIPKQIEEKGKEK
jgi:hypothetical protein